MSDSLPTDEKMARRGVPVAPAYFHMRLKATTIPGCFRIEYVNRSDERGSFVKTFQSTAFSELGLESSFNESFYSTSATGVLRGMHFQKPPADGGKLVYC